jgi:hypothetical protein
VQQIGVRIDAGELPGLAKQVEERSDLRPPQRLRSVVILPATTGPPPQRQLGSNVVELMHGSSTNRVTSVHRSSM